MLEIKRNISLKNFNTFKVDVKSAFFVEINNENNIDELLNSNLDITNKFILGGGSNVLFTKDFDGIILKNSIPGIAQKNEDSNEILLEVGAGVIWQDLVNYCAMNNYWGIENLSLIPGTVGAAPIQNIGAYGQELQNVFYSLEGFELSNKEKKIFNKYKCNFGYRESIFKNALRNKFLITSVTLKLSKKPNPILSYQPVKDEIENRGIKNPTISEICDIICEIRKSKLPDPNLIGNAGSFFKNPEISTDKFFQIKKDFNDLEGYKTNENKMKISAAWLIEKCGWKGKRKGDVACFEKQSLVLVNYGNATGKDILDFSQSIKESVKSKFDIDLKKEINII